MSIFNLVDNAKFTTLNYLAVYLKNQLNSDEHALEVLDNYQKINSIAWLQAFDFRKPETLQTIICETCGYTHTDTAKNIINKSLLAPHLKHNWYITKPDAKPKSNHAFNDDLAEIKDMLKKIMGALDV